LKYRRQNRAISFKRQLLNSGLMSSLATPSDLASRPAFQPMTIEGKPLSGRMILQTGKPLTSAVARVTVLLGIKSVLPVDVHLGKIELPGRKRRRNEPAVRE